VIGPEGIKMEEEKVKSILEWLIPKGVKDIQKFLRLTKLLLAVDQGFCSNN